MTEPSTARSSVGDGTGPPTRIEGLDLIRGLAVAAVMLRHAVPGAFPGAGVVGVVMFFALSGYLITGVLRTELAATGRLRLGRFYLRRVRRLVPALVVLVAVVAVVTLTLDPLGDRSRLPATVLVALTWTGNLPLAEASEATFHLWTLATEEQFYLLWPVVLAAAFVRGRVGHAVVAVAACCLLAAVATLWWLRSDPDLAYALPTSWAGCFVIGAAARLWQDRLPRPGPWATMPVLAALTVLAVVPLRGHALTYLVAAPVVAALTCVLLLRWRSWTRVDAPGLRPLVWLGVVSYAAYLWNYPLTMWFRPHSSRPGWPDPSPPSRPSAARS